MTYNDFKLLLKLRLSYSVVFSSVSGYLLGFDVFNGFFFGGLIIGGFLMVISSNIFNQIVERDLDALMKRTGDRPLPQKKISVVRAFVLASFLAVFGIASLYWVNPKTAFFGALSLFLYVGVYTPLKTKTPLAVFVGAFPGAIPFMLGWVAATNKFGIEPGVLFMIQFLWQFPHFWGIGWLLDHDYKKAGFKMLPTLKKDQKTSFQILFYSLWTVVISIVPSLGVTGSLHLSFISAIIVVSLGIALFYFALNLHKNQSNTAAKKLIIATILYITLLQIVYVLDRFFIR